MSHGQEHHALDSSAYGKSQSTIDGRLLAIGIGQAPKISITAKLEQVLSTVWFYNGSAADGNGLAASNISIETLSRQTWWSSLPPM